MNPLTDEPKVAIAGDWHGNTNWAIAALKALRAEGIKTVYHVGDFGFWPALDGVKYVRAITRQLAIYDMTLYVTPGNHDDYVQLGAKEISADGLQWFSDRIAAMPRGFRWEVNGRSFVSLGGAPSINFEDLKQGISWWPEEALTLGDVYRLAEKGHADIMITHDAPDGVLALETLMNSNAEERDKVGAGISARGIAYGDEGRRLMTQAVQIVKPLMVFHGHYHLDYVEDVPFAEGDFITRFVGMNKDTDPNNICILDTNTLEWEWVPVKW
ncbi:MAG: metallophosphoesterase [Enterococcus sp.]|nr:metallophosphoesterase [Enterococcus sp.]